MNIPESITMMGHTISVEYSDMLVFQQDSLGLSDYRNNKIVLQRSLDTYPIPETIQDQVYLHEVIHFALNMLGELELRDNEKIVDNLAGLLNQALKESI